MQVTVDAQKIKLALYAAQYAAQPERVPVFHQWLCRNADTPDDIAPADQIPVSLAEAGIMVAALLAVYGASQTGSQAAGAPVT